MSTWQTSLDQLTPHLIAWRRDIHHYAEAAWREYRTASLIAEELSQLGYQLALGAEVLAADSRLGLPDQQTLAQEQQRALQQGALAQWLPYFQGGFTGLVASLVTDRAGPTLAYRFDIDAVEVNESLHAEHLPHQQGFASCNANMMHACGHDGHIAIGIGLAHLLMQYRHQLCGTIKLIFQPAEEGTRGAKAMVDAKVVDDVDYFVAMHLGTGVTAGHLICGCNTFMATRKIDVTFTGQAAHAGANPEQGKNALLAAAQATLALHSIAPHSQGLSRINVGQLVAGSGRNVIANHAILKLETRGATEAINDYVYQQAQQIIAGAAQMYQVASQLQLVGMATNISCSADWVAYIAEQAQQVAGIIQLDKGDNHTAGSEDATLMIERVQQQGGMASYLILGTDLAVGHHNERFDFDEQSLPVAVNLLSRLAFNLATWTTITPTKHLQP